MEIWKKRVCIGLLFVLLAFCNNAVMVLGHGILRGPWRDAAFHFSRLFSLKTILSTPVNFYSFSSNGNLVSLFYPWLTMTPMFLLYKITNSYMLAYKWFYTILGFVTLALSYYSMKKITKERQSAICFAVIYSFSFYRMVNIYLRAALGESISMAFLPLVLLGCYSIFFGDEKKWLPLTIGLTCIAYSHVLSLLLSVAIFGLMALFSFYWWDRKKERMMSLIKAGISALCLSMGALLPIFYSFLTMDIFHPDGSSKLMAEHAYSLTEIMSNAINNTPTKSLGTLIFIIFVSYFYFYKKTNEKDSKEVKTNEKDSKEVKVSIFFIALSILLIIGSSSIIPWSFIAKVPLIKKLCIIQFPWRFYAYITLFVAAAFSFVFNPSMNKKEI